MLNRFFSRILFLVLVTTPMAVFAKTLQVLSPDKHIQLSLNDNQGQLSYSVDFNDKSVIGDSKLGLLFNHQKGFAQPISINTSETNTVDQVWQQPWGERVQVRDHHNELLVTLSDQQGKPLSIGVRFRVFNDGIGFRYEGDKTAGQTSVEIINELTEFYFPNAEQTDAWWIPSRGWNRYEYQYNKTLLSDIDRAHTPATFRTKEGVHVSIHEAALVDFAAMTLDQRRTGRLRADLTPRSDGLRVKTHGAFVSPWRTIQIASKASGLVNSDLILNLNEPNKLGDVSWVQPGKYIGIWWGMHLNTVTWGSGAKHGATTERTIKYMDFAKKYGFDGVLVEGWNIGWDGSWFHNGDVFSFTESYDDFDIEKVHQHYKNTGVRLIGHHETSGSISNYENQMMDAYDFYQKHDVSQIKTGYVADGGDLKRIDQDGIVRKEWHDSQHAVNHYLYSVKEAAKRKISINTHEPIKDTGLRRTYPNWISREGARGQEFNAWGSPPNSPEHTVNLVYTRMLSGPMDFTPGIFNLAYEGLDAENRVRTTLAKQLALYVVLYSPIQMAADLIEHYEQNLPAFQFILDVPTDWQDSIALHGEVGDFAVIARQQKDSDDWFLGGITDEHARTVVIPLSFLEKGRQYEAQIYRDGANADWLTRPYDIKIESLQLNSSDSITLNMASSGGAAIRFRAL